MSNEIFGDGDVLEEPVPDLENLTDNEARPVLAAVPNAAAHAVAAAPVVNSRTVLLAVLLVGLALSWPVIHFVRLAVNFESTDDAYLGAPIATLSANVGGPVIEVHFDDNSHVKKNDVLVKIDPREYQITIKQLQAQLSSARAEYESTKKELDRGEFDNVVKRREQELQAVSALFDDAKSDLDRGEFDTIIKRRKSELESARALLVESKKELDRGEFDTIVKRRQSELDGATALVDEAQKTLARTKELEKKGLVSVKELEAATAASENQIGKRGAIAIQLREAQLAADKARDGAIANYRNNLGKVGALEIQLQEAYLATEKAKSSAVANYKNSFSRQAAQRVQLKEALIAAQTAQDQALKHYQQSIAKFWVIQAQLEQAKINLEATIIRAPADGTMGKRQIEPGMVVKPMQILTTFVESGIRWITANFKETQLDSIRVGQDVEIEVDAIKGKVFRGHVASIAAASGSSFAVIPPDNATGNFTKVVQRVPVRIDLDPASTQGYEDRLRPGLSAVPRVKIKSRKSGE